MVCATALEEAGHEIIGPVHDLETFEQLPGLNGTDLALVDINLAGANEGLGVARRLQESHDIPTLFMSGQIAAARESTHLALGMLRKPYDIEDLLAGVAYVQKVFLDGSATSAPKPPGLEIFKSV